MYEISTQSERHPGRGKSTQSRNSKYKTASTELVTDSRRRKDWKIRLEAKIKGLILQDKQDVAFFSRQRKSAGRFLSHWKVFKSLEGLPLEDKSLHDTLRTLWTGQSRNRGRTVSALTHRSRSLI